MDALDAAAELAAPEEIVRATAREMAVRGTGMSAVHVLDGWPATEVALVEGYAGADPMPREPLEAYKRVYRQVGLTYDRVHVAPAQRDRWFEVLGDGLMTPAQLRRDPGYVNAISRVDAWEHGRVIVCVGSRPVGALYGFVPSSREAFTSAQRARLAATAERLAPAIRVAARLHAADARTSAVEYLMSSRVDASCMVSAHGVLLACSPRAERWLATHPSLRDAIGSAVRTPGLSPRTVDGIAIHATPCASGGGGAAILVLLARVTPVTSGDLPLTPRQAQLLDLLELGCTNAEIADTMGCSPLTVKTWLQRLYKRAGVTTRGALVHWSRTNGD